MNKQAWQSMTRFQQLLDQDEYSESDLIELDTLSQNIEQAIIDRAKYIHMLNAREKAVIQEIDRLKKIAKAISSKANTQESIIKTMMLESLLTKIDTDPLITVKLRESPWSVQVDDIDSVPDDYKVNKVEVTIDKKKIIDHYKSDKTEVTGVKIIKNKYIQII